MFKERYIKIVKHITPDEDVKKRIISECEKQTAKKGRAKFIPIIAAIIIVIAFPVMAYRGYIDSIAKILKEENNTRITPAISTAISNGIKMELNGGTYSGNSLSLYISVEDTMKDRIKSDAIYLNQNIFYNGDQIEINGGSSRDNFDKANNKKITRLDFYPYESLKEKSKLQLKTDYILSNIEEIKHIEIPAEKIITEKTIDLRKNDTGFYEAGYIGFEEASEAERKKFDPFNENHIICIKPENNDTVLKNDMNILYYNNSGFVNGKLHINISYASPIKERTYVKLYAVNSKGEKKYAVYSQGIRPADMAATANLSKGASITQRKYEQFVFDIGKEEFKDCHIYADVKYYSYQLDGPFILDFDCNEFLTDCIVKENIPFGNRIIERLQITPVCIFGKINEGYAGGYGSYIYDDGTEYEFTSGSGGNNGEFTLNPETYIDMDRLSKIIINDIIVYEKHNSA